MKSEKTIVQKMLNHARMGGGRKFMGLMRPMRLMGLMGLMGLIGLIGLMGLMGCSADEESEEEKHHPVEVMGVVSLYEEAEEAHRANRANRANGANEANGAKGAYGAYVTRGWTPPSGYTFMETSNQVFGVFLTRNGSEPIKGHFYSNSDGSNWYTSLEISDEGTYYLYGYTPHSNGVSCDISSTATPGDNSAYSSGAVLTISNLPSVTSNDVCVVVGAKNGKDNGYSDSGDYEITGLRRGDFAYQADATGELYNNYVFLLFDHLYSAFQVRMKVNGDYDALRTIVLKELYLQTSAGGSVTKKRTNVTVTLAATESTIDPVTGLYPDPIRSVVFTPVGTDEGDGAILSPTDTPVTLSTAYSSYMCHFMPMGVDKLILTSVYDVYDKKGNLVRENCKATNTMVLSDLFSEQDVSRRGCRYNVNLIIQPTYLYVMSDPDLNDPTVVVGD